MPRQPHRQIHVHVSCKRLHLHQRLLEVQRARETDGASVSLSDLIWEAVAQWYPVMTSPPKGGVPEARSAERDATGRISVSFPEESQWLLKLLRDTVLAKEAAGGHSTLSAEVVAWLRCAVMCDVAYMVAIRRALGISAEGDVMAQTRNFDKSWVPYVRDFFKSRGVDVAVGGKTGRTVLMLGNETAVLTAEGMLTGIGPEMSKILDEFYRKVATVPEVKNSGTAQ